MRRAATRGLVLVLVLGLAGVAWCKAPKASGPSGGKSGKVNAASLDLMEAATAAGFTRFAALVQTAGLADTFKGEKAHTLFIPTDEAIAAVPAAALDALVKEPEKLKTVLLNHVVMGDREIRKMAKMSGARTLGGTDLALKLDGKQVLVSGARVVKPETTCKNGRFCGIDKLLLPVEQKP